MYGMKTPLYNHPRLSEKLNRKAKDNAAEEKPLSVLDDAVFKAMLTTDSEDSREANLEIARKMKAAGRPFTEIAEFTGLPPETIADL
jgi:hypothetical protein